MADLIVLLSLLFAIAFVAAWVFLPGVRAWIERPKHRFQDNVQKYEQARMAAEKPRRAAERPRRAAER